MDSDQSYTDSEIRAAAVFRALESLTFVFLDQLGPSTFDVTYTNGEEAQKRRGASSRPTPLQIQDEVFSPDIACAK